MVTLTGSLHQAHEEFFVTQSVHVTKLSQSLKKRERERK